MKYTNQDYIWFFKNYKPEYYEINGGWHFFTLATQHIDIYKEFNDAIDEIIDYIKDGNWKPEETGFSRMIAKLESEPLSENMENITYNDNEIMDWLEKHIDNEFKKFIK